MFGDSMKMSKDDLHELALEKGVTVTIGHAKFNADKTKLEAAPRDFRHPEVGVDAEPKPVSAPKEVPAAPTKWKFEVERNSQGLIESVIATAT
jgi:hypothetical protein